MKQFERVVGNILAGILMLIIAASILMSVFNFLFRDGRGGSSYGSRGDYYMAD